MFFLSNSLSFLRPSKKRGVAAQFHSNISLNEEQRKEIEKLYAISLEDGFYNLKPYNKDVLLKEIESFSCLVIDRVARKAPLLGRVIVDYCGANIGKPLHFGHVRSTMVGDIIKRLYLANGFDALGDIHLGDNTQNFSLAILGADFINVSPKNMQLNDCRKAYEVAFQKAENDQDFKNKVEEVNFNLQKDIVLNNHSENLVAFRNMRSLSVEYIKSFLSLLNASIEIWQGESDSFSICKQLVEELLQQKICHIKEEAVYYHDFVVLRKNGTFLYSTTDIATIYERFVKEGVDEAVYVVDERQREHFENVFKICKEIGWLKGKVRFVGFGMVLDSQGKPLKSRSKEFKNINETLQEVLNLNVQQDVLCTLLRCYDMQHNIFKSYKWAPAKATDLKGKSGFYILYTYARLKSIIKKRETITHEEHVSHLKEEHFNELLAVMCQIQHCLLLSLETLVIGSVFNLLYESSVIFNRIYEETVLIFKLNEKDFRLFMVFQKFYEGIANIIGVKLIDRL